ncbi:uncharacterized protein TNCT_135831 [Trichonephila clavata]|uniref:Uncharacterized protein n=1 Tax=Trichonephila clavata TaxID=2740835 RepID=A0A8X6II84_TRICU|nr:uncharacterized protein TNCT_135831 [Trichonephila clavata]
MTTPYFYMCNPNLLHINSVIMFLKQAISFVMRCNNLSWEPPVSTIIDEFNPTPFPLFQPTFGTAIAHICMEELFSRYEPEWSLLPEIEATTYIQNYLKALVEGVPHESYDTNFYFVSFICRFCVQAIRLDRSEIVPCILTEAALILFSRCNSFDDIFNLHQAAIEYINQHCKKCRKRRR